MSVRVVLRPEAQAEFDDAFGWYGRQRPGLGIDFVAHVQEVIDLGDPVLHLEYWDVH